MTNMQRFKIKEICSVKRGGSPRPIDKYLVSSDAPGRNWLLIGDIEKDTDYITKTSAKIKEDGVSKTTLVYPGELILSNSMSFGRPYIMQVESCIHDGWLALKNIATDKIDIKYFYYLLRCDSAQRDFNRLSAGSGVRNLKREMVEDIVIEIPNLNIQQRIVQILDTINDYVSEVERYLVYEKQKLEVLKYKLLLLDGSDNYSYKLKDLFDFKNGYTPSKSVKEYWNNGALPWFRMEDIRNNGRILNDSIQHVTCKAVKGKLFPKDSIIMSTTATIGEYAWLTSDSLANQRFTFLTRKLNCWGKIDIEYFYHYCSILSEWCKRNVNSGGLLAVDMNAFMNYKIVLPNIERQKYIANLLSMQEEKIKLYEKKKMLISKQYKYLLNHLINGDFDLSNIKLEEGKE